MRQREEVGSYQVKHETISAELENRGKCECARYPPDLGTVEKSKRELREMGIQTHRTV
jgi:hypothetical protein